MGRGREGLLRGRRARVQLRAGGRLRDPPRGRDDAGEIKTGAFETFGAGRSGADISCACHWATNAAAGERTGQLVATAYSVAPCAIVVPPESPVRRPEDLAGVPVGVGYHSGSHFTTVQALEAVLSPEEVKLTFQGPPNERLDALLERRAPAAAMFGVPLYIAEAFGFRKVLDATFMIGFLVTGRDVSQADVGKYLAALRRAQMEIDLALSSTSITTCGPYRRSTGTRLTYGLLAPANVSSSSYTWEVFAATQAWTEAHEIFPRPPGSPPATTRLSWPDSRARRPAAAATCVRRWLAESVRDAEDCPVDRSGETAITGFRGLAGSAGYPGGFA